MKLAAGTEGAKEEAGGPSSERMMGTLLGRDLMACAGRTTEAPAVQAFMDRRNAEIPCYERRGTVKSGVKEEKRTLIES